MENNNYKNFCECCGQEIEEELPKPNPNFKLVSRFEETKEEKEVKEKRRFVEDDTLLNYKEDD